MLKEITIMTAIAMVFSSCQIEEHEFEKYYGPYGDVRTNATPETFCKAYTLKDPKVIEERKNLMKKYRDQARSGNLQGYINYMYMKDASGETILHLAALTNSIREIKQELSDNTDIDIWTLGSFKLGPGGIGQKEHVGRETPLHYAARGNAKEAYEYLLERGADPDWKDSKGRTPKKILEMADKSAQ